jgi:hypothetical protein
LAYLSGVHDHNDVGRVSLQPVSLSRQVSVKKIEALMEIGRQEKRDDLHSILLLAEECGGRVTPRDISQKLLLGRPESAAKALIDRCTYYEILGPSGELTDAGREALKTAQVFIPERGRYLVWYTEDLLVPSQLMDLEPVEETRLHDEVMMKQDRSKKPSATQEERSQDLPNTLHFLEGKTFDLFGHEHGQVAIKKIESRVVSRNPNDSDIVRVNLRLSSTSPTMVSLDGKFKRTLPPPRVDFSQAWLDLLGPLSTQWDTSKNPPALRKSFEELGEGELGSFTTNLKLRGPQVTGLGNFDDTVVQGVPIAPRTEHDANSWARWLLLRSIDTYVAGPRYAELVARCIARFPGYHDMKLPSQSQLAKELDEQKNEAPLPEQYWYLQAPLDLEETVEASQS